MEEERPSKWESPIVAWGVLGLLFAAFFLARALVGPAIQVFVALPLGLSFAKLFAGSRPERYGYDGRILRVFLPGVVLLVGGVVVAAVGAPEIGLPAMLFGVGAISGVQHHRRRRAF